MKNGGSFHSYVNVYQGVFTATQRHLYLHTVFVPTPGNPDTLDQLIATCSDYTDYTLRFRNAKLGCAVDF